VAGAGAAAGVELGAEASELTGGGGGGASVVVGAGAILAIRIGCLKWKSALTLIELGTSRGGSGSRSVDSTLSHVGDDGDHINLSHVVTLLENWRAKRAGDKKSREEC